MRNVAELYPLTPTQQGMLFESLRASRSSSPSPAGDALSPDSGASPGVLIEQLVLDLEGDLDPALLRRAWERALAAHPMLRTCFVWQGLERPVQVVREQVELPWSEHECGADELELATARILERDRAKGFDPARAPLMRVHLLRPSDRRARILWSVHHLVIDGWSGALVLRDLLADATALARGVADAPTVRPSLREYVEWIGAADLERARAFWTERLADVDEPTPIEIPAPRGELEPAAPVDRAGRIERELDRDLARALERLAREQRTTPATAVHAAWACLLARLSGVDDVVFGSVSSGRSADVDGVERLIGPLLHVLPARVRVDWRRPVGAWLRDVQAGLAAEREHELLPLAEIQRASGVGAGRKLFESLVAVETFPQAQADETGPFRVVGARVHSHPDAPLALLATPGERWTLEVAFDARRFDRAGVEAWLDELVGILAALPDAAQLPLSRVRPLRDRARDLEIARGLGASTEWPREHGLVALVREWVDRTPDALAIAVGDHELSYARLASLAAAGARKLGELGLAPEELVAICATRTDDLCVAMLAALSAGGAYLPIDPELPDTRIEHMARTARARIALCEASHVERLARLGLRCIEIRREASSATLALPAGGGERLAYVMFTSGSTGAPKGVAVAQRAVVRLVRGTDHVEFQAGDRIARATNPAFDVVCDEIWGALLNGAALIDVPQGVLLAPRELERLLRARRVTHLFLTTSLFHQLAREAPSTFAGLRTLVVGGEALLADPTRAVLEAAALEHLVNGYGPTEAGTFATWHDAAGSGASDAPERGSSVPIGKPLANTQAFVLDAQLEPVAPGVVGELYLGGDALARGYVGAPAETAKRFTPHPFARVPGERLYRTGDLARRDALGRLEFVGRRDAQIKLRGFRIELGEIEQALTSHPKVRAAAAALASAERAGPRLVAWYAPFDDSVAPAELASHVAERLPEYMVPSELIAVAELPRTRNGKLDRRALPQATTSSPRGRARALRDAVELVVAAAWSDALGCGEVGRDDDFFALGGHSLSAMRVAARLGEHLDVDVPLGVLFERTRLSDLADWLRERGAGAGAARDGRDAPQVDGRPGAPLSPAQQRLWIVERLTPDEPAYHLAGGVRIAGELDREALERALDAVVLRHDALRTRIEAHGDEPRQIVDADARIERSFEDLATLAADDREARFARVARDAARRPFDLERGPLLRATLARLGEREHALVLVLHHVIADGASLSILLDDLAGAYAAFARGGRPAWAAPSATYADWSLRERAKVGGDRRMALAAHWRRALGDPPPPLELPFDRAPREGIGRPVRGRTIEHELAPDVAAALPELARREGVTPFVAACAAFAVVVARASGRDDPWIGTPIDRRDRRDVEGAIGFFVDTLVLRCDLAGDPTLADAIARTRRVALDAWSHAGLPFAELVRELRPERALGRNPLFQAMFVLEDELEPLDFGPARATPFEVDTGTSNFDWTLTVRRSSTRTRVLLEHDAERFDEATAQRVLRWYERVLAAMVATPRARIADVDLVGEDERARLRAWSHGPAARVADGALARAFDQVAKRRADLVALVERERRVGYAELAASVRRLAGTLASRGIGPEDVVAIRAPRSVELAVAMLAIHRVGAAWLALDPAWPRARVEQLLLDCRARLVLAHASLAGDFAELAVETLALDARAFDAAELEAPVDVAPQAAAYVMYTSGSTGRPKGVVVSRRSLESFALGALAHVELDERDVVLHAASVGFDLSLEELFPALLSGARVVVRGEAAPASIDELHELCERERISVLDLPTAYWHEWVAALDASPRAMPASLRCVIAGGERASARAVAIWRRVAPRVRWIDSYGPTEATVAATAWELAREARVPSDDVPADDVPIGRPIVGATAWVLDARGALAPIGVVGELCLGGVGVARGYLGAPAATAERFVPDPFGERGARLYRTGDRARWRGDGELEFRGRADLQVKIRGFRVEPGEVEAELRRAAGVVDAVVVARGRGDQRVRLIGYVVARDRSTFDPRAAKAELATRLPAAMVPSAIVALDALPRTPTGKIDRAALPDAEVAADVEVAAADDLTDVESRIATIWREVLGLPSVRASDHFFELGGDSIGAIQVASRAARVGLKLTPRDLFLAPRLGDLARAASSAQPSIERREVDEPSGPIDLSPIQRWFLERDIAERARWNQSTLLDLRRPVRAQDLESAWGELARRHDALRTAFERAGDAWSARIVAPERVSIDLFDLSDLDERAQRTAIERACDRLQGSFELAKPPLVRVALFELGARRQRLFVALHHLVVDWISWGVLLGDLDLLLEASEAGRPASLASPSSSWRRWIGALDSASRDPSLHVELERWRAIDPGSIAALRRDHGGPPSDRDEAIVAVELDGKTTQALEDASRSHAATLEELALAALCGAVVRWTGARGAWIAVEGHGRAELDGLDLTRSVGWFTGLCPLLVDLKPSASAIDALRAARASLRSAPRRGLPWMLARHGSDPRLRAALAALPEPEIGFGFFGRVDAALDARARFVPLEEPRGRERAQATHPLDVNAWIERGELHARWHFDPQAFGRATVERLARDFLQRLGDLARAAAAAAAPADFPLAKLDPSSLAKVLRKLERPRAP